MPDKEYVSTKRLERLVKGSKEYAATLSEENARLHKKISHIAGLNNLYAEEHSELKKRVLELEAICKSIPDACPECGQTPLVRPEEDT